MEGPTSDDYRSRFCQESLGMAYRNDRRVCPAAAVMTNAILEGNFTREHDMWYVPVGAGLIATIACILLTTPSAWARHKQREAQRQKKKRAEHEEMSRQIEKEQDESPKWYTLHYLFSYAVAGATFGGAAIFAAAVFTADFSFKDAVSSLTRDAKLLGFVVGTSSAVFSLVGLLVRVFRGSERRTRREIDGGAKALGIWLFVGPVLLGAGWWLLSAIIDSVEEATTKDLLVVVVICLVVIIINQSRGRK